ncbi:MAG TPA: DNA double-strand break repair nuclease NurA [Pseudonocardiaceae bacterium]|nr:DNA double-strand break repair nuclease NurA [Pseudonocardiaceae bacterium]
MTALLTPTVYTIDPWDPSYGVAVAEELDGRESTAGLDYDVEVPKDQWRPIAANRTVPLPSSVLFLDGVRRIDAHLWVHGVGQQPEQGLVASLAAGLVCCNGVAEVIDVKVDRSLYSPVETATDLVTAHARYGARLTKPGPNGLMAGVQRRLAELEAELSAEWRERGTDDDLLVVDGPVHQGVQLPRTVGYVKTHRASYLDAQHTEVVASLAAGERTPVFAMGTEYRKHSWYLRLPGAAETPWSAIVRLECSPGLPVDDVVTLADVTTTVLPTLASTPHKDPRAPQNLVPIGGLERQLRHRLGDSALLYRSLRSAALRAR